MSIKVGSRSELYKIGTGWCGCHQATDESGRMFKYNEQLRRTFAILSVDGLQAVIANLGSKSQKGSAWTPSRLNSFDNSRLHIQERLNLSTLNDKRKAKDKSLWLSGIGRICIVCRPARLVTGLLHECTFINTKASNGQQDLIHILRFSEDVATFWKYHTLFCIYTHLVLQSGDSKRSDE